DNDHVGGQGLAVGQQDTVDVLVTCDLGDPDTAVDLHAVGGVQPTDGLADRRVEDASERRGQHVDDRDRGAATACAGGDLESDEAGAHDDDPRALDEHVAQGEAVVERPQDVYAVQSDAGQRARLGAGRDNDVGIVER